MNHSLWYAFLTHCASLLLMTIGSTTLAVPVVYRSCAGLRRLYGQQADGARCKGRNEDRDARWALLAGRVTGSAARNLHRSAVDFVDEFFEVAADVGPDILAFLKVLDEVETDVLALLSYSAFQPLIVQGIAHNVPAYSARTGSPC